MLLGKSSGYREILSTNAKEAKLALAALYLLMLLPLAMIVTRVAAELCMDGLSLLFIIRSWQARDWRWLKSAPVLIALTLWAYSALIVTPLAIEPVASLGRADWGRYIFLFAAIVYWLSAYHEEMKRVAWVILTMLFFAGLDALYQYNTGASLAGTPYVQERLTGPFRKVVIGIYTAKLCLPLIGIVLYYAWAEKKKWLKLLVPLMMAYLYAIVLLSNERTAILTLTLGLLLTAFGLFIGYKKARKPVVFLLAAGVLFVSMAFQSQQSLQHRFHVTKEIMMDFSSSQYAQLWHASMLMWQKHPATGVGMVNFRIVCPELQAEGKVNFCSTHSHNMYLEVLSEMGSIGFMLILLLVLSLFIMVAEEHSSRPKERILLTCFALGGLFLNFFPLAPTQSFFSNWPAMLAWQSVAWSIALVKGGYKESRDDDE